MTYENYMKFKLYCQIVSLKWNYVYLFMYCRYLLLHYNGRIEYSSCRKDYLSFQSLKFYPAFTEKFPIHVLELQLPCLLPSLSPSFQNTELILEMQQKVKLNRVKTTQSGWGWEVGLEGDRKIAQDAVLTQKQCSQLRSSSSA